MCLGIPDDSPDAKQQKLYEELGKVILKKLGLKTAPKVSKEQRNNVPQFLIDSYENLIKKSDGKGDERSDNTTLDNGLYITKFIKFINSGCALSLNTHS